MHLIKTSLPVGYILLPPNPAKGTLPLARSPFPVALLYRQTQIYIGITMHHCMLGANSAGDILFSSECVNLLQNKAAMLAHKAAMLAHSRCSGRRSLSLLTCPKLDLEFFRLSRTTVWVKCSRRMPMSVSFNITTKRWHPCWTAQMA